MDKKEAPVLRPRQPGNDSLEGDLIKWILINRRWLISGRLLIKFRDRDVWLDEGEFLIIPRGVEHLPVAEQVVHVLLFEPKATLNTGNVQSERTVADLEAI